MGVVHARCNDQGGLIDYLLEGLRSDPKANTRAGRQLIAELKSTQKALREIQAGIESDEKLIIDINNVPDLTNLGWWDPATLLEKLSGTQAHDVVSFNIVLTGDGDFVKLWEVTMHELSHKEGGVKGDHVGESWTNDAHVFDDLMSLSIQYTPWYTYRWLQMHWNPGDPVPAPPPVKQ